MHVIVGDSNMSEPTFALKVGSMLLVIEMLEAGFDLPDMELADPIAHIRDIAADPVAAGGLRPVHRGVRRGVRVTGRGVLGHEDRAHRRADGDVGTVDSDGYLKVTDRLKDVIKSGGEWISSIDMENLLTSHPAITEAAVVGLPHPKWQERPYVQVMLRPGATITLAEVHEHLSGAFASWQLPERVDVVTELPRTSVGKIDKKTIRGRHTDLYADASEAARPGGGAGDVEEGGRA